MLNVRPMALQLTALEILALLHDVTPEIVQVVAIVTKAEAAGWLAEYGTPDAPRGAR